MDRETMTLLGPFIAKGLQVRETPNGNLALYEPNGQWILTMANVPGRRHAVLLNALASLYHRDRHRRVRLFARS